MLPRTERPHPVASIYPTGERPSVIIVGAGRLAGRLSDIVESKGFPIRGSFSRPGAKIGQDLGIVSGLGRPLGHVVQDVATIAPGSAKADVALVCAAQTLRDNLETYRRLLEGGYNVLCLSSEAMHPRHFDPETAEEIDALAKANGVTFTGGGIWDMSRIWLGLLAVGPCTEIRRLVHTSTTDVARQLVSAEECRRYKLPMGISLDKFWSGGYANSYNGKLYATVPTMVLEAAGFTVTGYTPSIEPIVATSPMITHLHPDPIPAGYCIGIRIIADVTTKEGVTARSEAEQKLFQPGEEEYMAWRVEGAPGLSLRAVREDSENLTLMSQFNRVPDVIAARPGIAMLPELGPLKHSALV